MELCEVLKEAAIGIKGIFINAGAGFDSGGFNGVCAEKEIEAKIKPNPRNRKGNDV